MSHIGKSPTVDFLKLNPLAADPANPAEGDIYYSNGTPRDEGPWIYQDGSWQQISTGATLSVIPSLTLTPQSSDPGTPVQGMLFYSNGTPRAAGLWAYNGTGWVQITGVRYEEFKLKEYVNVRLATTGAITLNSQLENGDTIDGTTLITGDLVLVKNQVTASENGVYVVAASGAPSRHSSADTFSELNRYSANITEGTTNKNSIWFQTATLTSLSDNQTWATTPATYSFTVPTGITEIDILAVGGGGGGASGNGSISGGGGAGAVPLLFKQLVTPGDVLTIDIGRGGRGASNGAGVTGGNPGGSTTITGTGVSITMPGALGAAGNAGGLTTNAIVGIQFAAGGSGGVNGSAFPVAGASTIYAAGGSAQTGSDNAAGGGGAGYGAGGAGGQLATSGSPGLTGSGAGGGGGGQSASTSIKGGRGGAGYVRISW